MKRFLAVILVALLFPVNIFAYSPPTPNNKFGIHLAQPQTEDIEKAAQLVNSNGGNWGYITLVIQEDDRNVGKWQDVFNKLRELKLIPIIRLATKPEGGNWKRASAIDVQSWVSFLNQLNWVVKDRHVILFNETNHGSEWGGVVDPVSYAQVAKIFAQRLKESNKDYVVMLAGLDASAPASAPSYADEEYYLTQVVSAITPAEFNKYFDALSSHSYPNPGFVGSVSDTGRGTVRTYQWELELLNSLGIKQLPVFITETGWNGNSISRDQVASNFKTAYENIWLADSRVVGVTPFVLNYESEPFLQFSWLTKDNNEYPEYTIVKDMRKIAGNPTVIDKGAITFNLPKELVAESSYHFYFQSRNNGQAIWDATDGYKVSIEGLDPNTYLTSYINTVRPLQDRQQDFFLRTGEDPGTRKAKMVISKNNKVIAVSNEWTFAIVPLPSLTIKTALFPKINSQANDLEVQIFDDNEEVIYKEQDMKVNNGTSTIANVKNITLDKPYRIVLLKKYYLPVQRYWQFKKGENVVYFKNMYPVDFNSDGTFSIADVGYFVTHPQLLGLFML